MAAADEAGDFAALDRLNSAELFGGQDAFIAGLKPYPPWAGL